MEIFKYLTPERIDVLANGMLRFTQPGALNDPFELKPYFDTVAEAEAVRRTMVLDGDILRDEIRKRYRALPVHQRRQISFNAFHRRMLRFLRTEAGAEIWSDALAQVERASRALAPKLAQQLWTALETRVGVLSLSENGEHPLMWSHYAAAHTGFTIGFDSEHPFFDRRRSPNDEFYHLRAVQYRPREEFSALTDLDGTRVLACKTPEWEYESEWRMLALLEDAGETIGSGASAVHLFRFPVDAVSSLTLGLRADDELAAVIKDHLAAAYTEAELRRIVETPTGIRSAPA